MRESIAMEKETGNKAMVIEEIIKQKEPLISIIIPVYNILDCLEKCVNSCRNQTYQNLEILLIDDGSTDGTSELCDKLKEKDSRIRVYHKQNGGTSSARNLGIELAKGDYLGFVDSDDFISTEMYETLLNAIRQQKALVAQVSRDEIDDRGSKLPDVCIPPKEAYFCKTKDFLKELLLHKGDCSFCTKLFAKEVIKGKKFPEGKLNEDFYLILNILQEIDGIYILPQQYYHVFYRLGSNTRKEDKNQFSRVFTDIVENADWAEKIVQKYYPDLQEVCIRFGLVQRLDYLLHIPVPRMTKDNQFYQKVKKYLRHHRWDMIKNIYLTPKNKIYLLLLSVAPKKIRQLHKLYREIR